MNNKIAVLVTTTTFGFICSTSNIESAQAATFTYNLGGDNATRSSFTFTPNGFTEPQLRITAGEGGISKNVRRRSDGLGVVSDGGFSGQVDGREGNFESLRLRFEETVTLESATFARLQSNDGFRLFVDGNRLVNLRNNLDENNPFDFSSFPIDDRTGDIFRFSVSQSNDDYRLQSIVVSTPVPETSAIVPLLGLALIGLLSYSKSDKY